MKAIALFLGLVMSLVAKGQSSALHLNISSHNEMSDDSPAYNVDYTDSQTWQDVKNKLAMLVDTLEHYQARYNMQVESNFIFANLLHENAYSNSTDLLESMENHNLIEVDPHNHMDLDALSADYNPYNYADLAYLLDSCGISRIQTVGGYIYLSSDWQNATYDNWLNWPSGISAYTYDYTWTPQILWGGGTANHNNDPFSLGVWRPSGATPLTFRNHNSSNLINIGNGCEWVIQNNTNIDSMVLDIVNHLNYFQGLPSDPDMFICGTVIFNYRYILQPGYIEKVCELIRKLDVYVQNNQIIWMNISQKYDAWNASHTSADDYRLFCDDLAVGIVEPETNQLKIYPNPSSQYFSFEAPSFGRVQILDASGRLIYSENTLQGSNTISIEHFPEGYYLVQWEFQNAWAYAPLVVSK